MQGKAWRNFDPWLLVCALALVAYGLVVIRSATLLAAVHPPDGPLPVSTQLFTQAAYALLGLAAMVTLSALDYRVVGAFAPLLYAGSLGLLALVLALGTPVFGAQRWIAVGPLSFQPSELAKVAVIVALARYLGGKSAEEVAKLKTMLGSFAIVALPVALVYRQPDLGTALVLLAIWLGMSFAAGAALKWLAAALVVPFLGFPLVWRLLKDYMRRRLTTFLTPDRDPLGEGYNIIQARISVGAGGFWGRGLGNGTQTQLNFLRVQHTDFIFAVLGEELGFVGAMALLALFGALFWRCLRVAAYSRDTFGQLLATGVTTMLLFQLFVNVGMNIGLLPVTGIPLPFISFGGSSLVSIFVCLGLLQSVLVHAQTRRYDTRPSVKVPVSTRLGRVRFPARVAGVQWSHPNAVAVPPPAASASFRVGPEHSEGAGYRAPSLWSIDDRR